MLGFFGDVDVFVGGVRRTADSRSFRGQHRKDLLNGGSLLVTVDPKAVHFLRAAFEGARFVGDVRVDLDCFLRDDVTGLFDGYFLQKVIVLNEIVAVGQGNHAHSDALAHLVLRPHQVAVAFGRGHRDVNDDLRLGRGGRHGRALLLEGRRKLVIEHASHGQRRHDPITGMLRVVRAAFERREIRILKTGCHGDALPRQGPMAHGALITKRGGLGGASAEKGHSDESNRGGQSAKMFVKREHGFSSLSFIEFKIHAFSHKSQLTALSMSLNEARHSPVSGDSVLRSFKPPFLRNSKSRQFGAKCLVFRLLHFTGEATTPRDFFLPNCSNCVALWFNLTKS